MQENTNQSEVELPVPPVSQATKEVLQNFGPLMADDYRQFKEHFLRWLLTEGKDTYRGEGYSEATTRTTHYKVDESYRWLWEEREEYTKVLKPDDATELIDHLARKTPHPDGYTYTFEKSLRRLFKFKREKLSQPLNEWDHDIPLRKNQDTTEERDRFYASEMNSLYNAALEKYSVKSYDNPNLNEEERDEIKTHLAQRLGKQKSELKRADFKRANSWKIPSIIAVTADLGLRPKEVGNARVSWLDLQNQKVTIPSSQAIKSDKSWECSLSTKTVNALRKWLRERDSYPKYDGTDQLWLTEQGNPYNSGSLNRLLGKLIEAAEIEQRGRNLSWYSFRHGVATIWAEEEGIYRAKNQLRHSSIKTTIRYTRNGGSGQSHLADSMW